MKAKLKLAAGRGWLARLVRRVDWIIIDRSPDWCVTNWWMKCAYRDYARREAVMVAWPFNYVVQLAWMLNLAWSRYRHRKSWIDRKVEERMSSANTEDRHEAKKSQPTKENQ